MAVKHENFARKKNMRIKVSKRYFTPVTLAEKKNFTNIVVRKHAFFICG